MRLIKNFLLFSIFLSSFAIVPQLQANEDNSVFIDDYDYNQCHKMYNDQQAILDETYYESIEKIDNSKFSVPLKELLRKQAKELKNMEQQQLSELKQLLQTHLQEREKLNLEQNLYSNANRRAVKSLYEIGIGN